MTIEIVDLKTLDPKDWMAMVKENHPFRPQWWVPGASSGTQAGLMGEALQHAVQDEQTALTGYVKDGELSGFAELRRMVWDTDHYGFPIYRLDYFGLWGRAQASRVDAEGLAAAVVRQARALGARAVHTWLPMEAIRGIQALEASGFQTMDILVTWLYEHGKQKLSDYPDRCIIRGARPGDEAPLVELAREAYTDTPDRFHADPHLPQERSNALYAEWIRNSFLGKLADYIVVAEVDGKPAGYTTLRLEGTHNGLSNVCTGGLILSAVAPWAEGKGVYTSMINGGMKWFEAQGVQVSHLGTQVNNYPVQRAWARLGFRLVKSGPSLHLWLGE